MEPIVLFVWTIVVVMAGFLLYLTRMHMLPAAPGLLILGLVISQISALSIPDIIIEFLVTLTLPLLIFDVFSRLHMKKMDTIIHHALSTSGLLLIFSALIVGMVSFTIFPAIDNILISILLGLFLLAPTDFDIPLRKHPKTITEYLYAESIMSSAITLVFVFSILSVIMWGLGQGVLSILLGFGLGLIFGIVLFKAISVRGSEKISHITLILGTIACFLMARVIGAEPVIAVATMGYFFGNVTIVKREQLTEFFVEFSHGVDAMLFLLLPIVIFIPLDQTLFLSLMIVLMFYIARYISLLKATHHDFSMMENVFLTLFNPKGSLTIAMLLYIYLLRPIEFQPLYTIIAVAVLATVLISSVVAHYGHSFSKRL
jgi:NhaP-type Na+/H+ or K+/H+ antiporter